MNVILAVGKKKTGKTTWVKEVSLSKFENIKRKIVFDPNLHYTEKEFIQYPDSDKKRAIVDFLAKTKDVKNSLLIIEEATIQFKSSSRQEDLESLLVRSRHQNNVLILCFHSLRSLPTWIFDQVDAVKLFKTMDTRKTVEKFKGVEKIEEAFVEVTLLSTDLHESRFISFM